MRYLYGASIQGIQDFIFKTNKLKEIVGASEIVKEIEGFFAKNYQPKVLLRNAGGNIKAIFDEDECKRVVLNFPKEIMQQAYGITLSQAVVKMEGEFEDEDKANIEIERVLRIQRNKPTVPLDLSLGIMKLNPSTAKPVVGYRKIQKESTAIDRVTSQKLDAYDRLLKQKPHLKKFREIKDFSNGKNKIAVIHADGNGLGKLVPLLGDELSSFSQSLEIATKEAFAMAKRNYMDIRDVILGGDDMVIICNANNALEFTQNFLQNFENETSKIDAIKRLKREGKIDFSKLTACAGIAYSNEKFPFHYAVGLAEELCKEAKEHSDREASCLMFHNIQSSNFQTWESFIENELTISNNHETIRCDFGAYYLDKENQPTIQDLITVIESYRYSGSPISRLREWIGELGRSSVYAKSMLERINAMAEQSSEWRDDIMNENLQRLYRGLSNKDLIVFRDGEKKTPIYDVLQILSATEAK